MSFGMMCSEWASKRVSYVAYLEYAGCGTANLVRPILRSYAEFLSLIAPGWVLHIWADAIRDEAYLFRNRRHEDNQTAGGNSNRSAELREMYAALLTQSGFEGAPYKWELIIPGLPDFGKKNEGSVRKLYAEIVVAADALKSKFGNTLCTQLQWKDEFPALPSYAGWYTIIARPPPSLPDHTFFSEDTKLDFGDAAKAAASTDHFLDKLKSFGPNFYLSGSLQRLDSIGLRDYYEAVLAFVRQVQRP